MEQELDLPNFNNLTTISQKKTKSKSTPSNNSNRSNNSNKSKKNTVVSKAKKKMKSLVESLGIEELESQTDTNAPGFVLKANSKLKLSKKYKKECKEGEEQYNTNEPPIDFKGYRDGFKKVKTSTLIEKNGFGLIIPALSLLDFSIFVDKQKKPKCYRKTRKVIEKGSVQPGGICYKSSDCDDGVCEDNLFGALEGKCKKNRKTVNVEEGELCANSEECKEGLKCDTWGIGLGECKKKK